MLKRRFTFASPIRLLTSPPTALQTTQRSPTKSLHPQGLGPRLLEGWGAGRLCNRVAPLNRLRSDPLNLAGLARRRESAITASITVPSFRPKAVIIGAGGMALG